MTKKKSKSSVRKKGLPKAKKVTPAKKKSAARASLEKTAPIWRLDVVSSNILRAAYNPVKHEMLIEFHSGERYIYEEVSVKEFLKFTKAESHGLFLNKYIKNVKEVRKMRNTK